MKSLTRIHSYKLGNKELIAPLLVLPCYLFNDTK